MVKPGQFLGYAMSLFLLAGCAVQVQSTQLRSIDYPVRPGDYIIAIYRDTLPQTSFVEIAAVQARKRGIDSNEKVINALKDRARELGGDAIIGLTLKTVSRDIIDVNKGFRTVRYQIYLGTVIRFLKPHRNTDY